MSGGATSRGAVGRLARVAPYLLIGFLYFATSPYHQGLNNPNEMVRVYMTRALVDFDTPAIDRVIREWGGVDDKAMRDGALYSSKAPFHSLVGVPFYAAFGARDDGIPPDRRRTTTLLRLGASAAPGLIFAGLLLAWLRRRASRLGIGRPLGTAAGLSLALGSMLYPYAITFTGHIWAAIGAGGCTLALAEVLRAPPTSRRFLGYATLAGALGGLTPFAEYPAALVALPALVAALVAVRGTARLRLLGGLALGGAAPFGLGLWSHQLLWGSPLKTGYSFLENKAYVQVHGSGFFGVGAPQPEAFLGALFSPGTGLFFFCPVLVLGLWAMTRRALGRGPDASWDASAELGLPRPLAIAGVVGFVLSVLFISGHNGWRGGWTVGPRYIIAVAPVLGLWLPDAARGPRGAALLGPLGAASILATGFAAALYPHLSDVFVNPLGSFLWPSYRLGATSYGLGHRLAAALAPGSGVAGHLANLVHVLPLAGALAFVALSPALAGRRSRPRAVLGAGVVLAAFVGLIAAIPERDPGAAARENDRLWGFWEPPMPTPEAAPGTVFHARTHWRLTRVEAEHETEGRVVPCRWTHGRCDYGGQPWQHFGPETLPFDGVQRTVLHVHPITGWIVRLRFSLPVDARRAVLHYGLTDASATADNPVPVRLSVRTASTGPAAEHLLAPGRRGLEALPLELPPGPSAGRRELIVELRTRRDGARVMGLDLELPP